MKKVFNGSEFKYTCFDDVFEADMKKDYNVRQKSKIGKRFGFIRGIDTLLQISNLSRFSIASFFSLFFPFCFSFSFFRRTFGSTVVCCCLCYFCFFESKRHLNSLSILREWEIMEIFFAHSALILHRKLTLIWSGYPAETGKGKKIFVEKIECNEKKVEKDALITLLDFHFLLISETYRFYCLFLQLLL